MTQEGGGRGRRKNSIVRFHHGDVAADAADDATGAENAAATDLVMLLLLLKTELHGAAAGFGVAR